jgi:hypothetical protein
LSNNFHFILDFETIGQDVFQVPIVNCSYYIFDWDRFTSNNPYTFNELIKEIKFAKFNVQQQVEEDGCVFHKQDLQWWMDQGPEARKQIKPSEDDITVAKFVEKIYGYCKATKTKRWWSRSNTFDPILLHRCFRHHGHRGKLDEVLPYWNVRDIRTYIDTQFQFQNRKNAFCPIDDEELWNKYFIAHNSVHDVAADILRMQRIERSIHVDE